MSREQDQDEPIPMLDLAAQNGPLSQELRQAFERVLESGRFILGPEVEELEYQLKARFGFGHAIGVSSGSDALLLSLMTLELGPGDEVITTPFSFFATAGAIHRLGARPVFVDIEPDTFNLDPDQVEAAITDRTRAILPVHVFGRPADMPGLRGIAQEYGLHLVEDAAQALGAELGRDTVGSLGELGCFSFFPSKNLGGFGDGGLLTSQDPDLAERARVLRSHGASPKYHHALVGGNFRLDALQAALLLVKLPYLHSWCEARRQHARRYNELLGAAGLSPERLSLPSVTDGHVFNQYVIASDRRDALRAALDGAQIASEIYYPVPLHLQACFSELGYSPGDMPEAERACARVLALPVYPELSEAQIERVARVVLTVLQ